MPNVRGGEQECGGTEVLQREAEERLQAGEAGGRARVVAATAGGETGCRIYLCVDVDSVDDADRDLFWKRSENRGGNSCRWHRV